MKNAMELRTLVMDNALSLGRLDKETLGKKDYDTLTTLYRNALDALTEWAGKDYAHTSVKEDADDSFTAVKAILSLFTVEKTDEDGETVEERIIIDQVSMRTMRDCATKPKRLYSSAYTKAEKARKAAAKVVAERYEDLITLGAPERNDDESIEDYVARVRELGVKTTIGTAKSAPKLSREECMLAIAEGKTLEEAQAEKDAQYVPTDMLDMYITANVILIVKEKAVHDIKNAGNWTWRRPVAVDIATFADLIENYIADCLMDGYNLKSSKTIRNEKAEARKLAKAEKEQAKKELTAA